MKDKNLPRTAICDGILRCERLGSPAVIERETYAIHVRKLPAGEGKGWVVRVVDKVNVFERHEEDTAITTGIG